MPSKDTASAPMGASSGRTTTRGKLHEGAELHWPGSGQHFVAIYSCLAAKRGASLGAAIKISAALQCHDERRCLLAELRGEIMRMAATRSGPKAHRHAAALVAIDALDAMLADEAAP